MNEWEVSEEVSDTKPFDGILDGVSCFTGGRGDCCIKDGDEWYIGSDYLDYITDDGYSGYKILEVPTGNVYFLYNGEKKYVQKNCQWNRKVLSSDLVPLHP